MGFASDQVRDGWREVFSRLEESGLSMAAFCRREGIPYWKLMYWKKRLALSDNDDAQRPSFAELIVERTTDGSARGRAVLEIALPGGAVVRVFEGTNAQMLQAVFEAASRC